MDSQIQSLLDEIEIDSEKAKEILRRNNERSRKIHDRVAEILNADLKKYKPIGSNLDFKFHRNNIVVYILGTCPGPAGLHALYFDDELCLCLFCGKELC